MDIPSNRTEPMPPSDPGGVSDPRWRFIRDVGVFQLKLFLSNVRDFALVPVSLIAALIDLVHEGERPGSRFYKVLEWGWHSERVIDQYSVIERDESAPLGHDFTVDAVLSEVEGAVARAYRQGGSAASLKEAVDRAIDGLQIRKTGKNGKDDAPPDAHA